ncbi:cytochrome P450, partial [Trifolium medium]|nr:cytochrome P450 [Trifolium medium]
PPPRGTLKMNVDAHLSGDDRWFSGLILRRCDGSIVGASTRAHTGIGDAIFGEALGLNEAVCWLEKIGHGRVIIELDSQILVNAVKRKGRIRHCWGYSVQRCVSFLEANPNSDIKWVSRLGNQAAHLLAKWAEKEPNIEWSNSVPLCIMPQIQKDLGFVHSV